MKPEPGAPGLKRLLGAREGTAIAIGVAIGAGIFRTPGSVAGCLPSAPWILGVWALGGLFALVDALVLAELAAMRPEAGGHYVFLRDAWGERVGFLYGWSAAFLTWPASIAAVAASADDFAARLGVGGGVAGAFVILAPASVHSLGVRTGSLAQDLLSYGKALGLAAFAGAAFWFAPARSAAAPAATPLALAGVGIALQRVLWTYDGYAEAVFVGEEMRDPGRSVPRALLRSILLLTALYVGLNAAFLACLTPAEMAGSTLVAADAAGRVGGPVAVRAVEALALLTVLAGASAMLLSGPRISYAMARDGILFRGFARVADNGTPQRCLWSMTALALAYWATSGFDRIVETTIFVIWLSVTLTTLALFRFRQREPDRRRPFRVPAHPWLPGLLLAAALALLVDMVVHVPRSVAAGGAVIAVGAGTYELWRRRRRPSRPPAS